MRAESTRLQQQMGNLKTEKTAIEKEIVRMTKRIEELEAAIGKDSDDEPWRNENNRQLILVWVFQR